MRVAGSVHSLEVEGACMRLIRTMPWLAAIQSYAQVTTLSKSVLYKEVSQKSALIYYGELR